jgi:cellulose synthase/poly-beta-1,6-N-acetylglucosamine synthase-like glycosyltransferase
MGYAFKHLFSKIDEDFGIDSFDGFVIFNADNVVSRDYFDKLNDAFIAGDKKNVITSFRNSKNFGDNYISAMYGLYFMYGCRFEARGRTVLGCSTRVQGTGYLIGSDIVSEGWKYVTLTEDWEFTADQLLRGTKIVFCDEAVFYDEQPTTPSVMWRQRVRWARGHLLVFLTRYKDIIRALFKPTKSGGASDKISIYDFSVNILPVGIIGVGLALLHLLALIISPLFCNYEIIPTVLEYLQSYAVSIFSSYVTVILSSFILLIIERKRIGRIAPQKLFLAILLWPAFVLLAAPCDIVAMFSRNLGWKVIPHKSDTKIEDIVK